MPKKPERSSSLWEARESPGPTGLVLDTHVTIWLLAGDARLKKPVRSRLETAAESEGLFLPAISVWEIGMLESKGRIRLEGGVAAWMRRALQLSGIHLAPLHPEIALAAASLEDFHGDPADRMIVATAIHLGFPLATADEKIQRWAPKHRLSLLPIT